MNHVNFRFNKLIIGRSMGVAICILLVVASMSVATTDSPKATNAQTLNN